MSQTRSGYKQSVNGLVGAIAISLLLIASIWLLSRFHDHQSFNPTATVDYSQPLADARAAHAFKPFAPRDVPPGWRATSASATGAGSALAWHLGFLTSSGADAQYVGLDQSNDNAAAYRQATTRADQPGATVTIDGRQWEIWTSTDGGETALIRTDASGTTTIVSGTASEFVLVTFVGSLSTR